MTPRSKKARKQIRMLVRKGESGLQATEAKRQAAIAYAAVSASGTPIIPSTGSAIEVEEDISMGELPKQSVELTRRNKIAVARAVINDIHGKPLPQARTGGFVKRSRTVDTDTASKMKMAGKKAGVKIGGKIQSQAVRSKVAARG